MDLANEPIFAYFAQIAYQPYLVYSVIVAMMFASSFGLPFPEEVTIVSAGFIAHMSLHPEMFPPPIGATSSVHPITTAIICFLAVYLSDILVFMLGRIYGTQLLRTKMFARYTSSTAMRKVEDFTHKHGALACGFFRFTPGLRFPGHFACGSLGIPVWKFLTVDGLAALLTVPTQVLLIAYYGELMLSFLKEFKILIISAAVVAVLYYFLRKFLLKRL